MAHPRNVPGGNLHHQCSSGWWATLQNLLLWMATQPRVFPGSVLNRQSALLMASIWSSVFGRTPTITPPAQVSPTGYPERCWAHLDLFGHHPSQLFGGITLQANAPTPGHLSLRFTWITKIIPAPGNPGSSNESGCVRYDFISSSDVSREAQEREKQCVLFFVFSLAGCTPHFQACGWPWHVRSETSCRRDRRSLTFSASTLYQENQSHWLSTSGGTLEPTWESLKKLLRLGPAPEVWVGQCGGTVWMWRVWNPWTFQLRKARHSLPWDLHDLLQKLSDLGRAMTEGDVGVWAAILS